MKEAGQQKDTTHAAMKARVRDLEAELSRLKKAIDEHLQSLESARQDPLRRRDNDSTR